MRLLLDEMYPPRLARELGRRGHDVAAVADRPDLRATEDRQLLIIATGEDRILVTENTADFPDIAAALAIEKEPHAGILLVSSATFPRTERGFGILVRALDAYLREHAAERAVGGGVRWLPAVSR